MRRAWWRHILPGRACPTGAIRQVQPTGTRSPVTPLEIPNRLPSCYPISVPGCTASSPPCPPPLPQAYPRCSYTISEQQGRGDGGAFSKPCAGVDPEDPACARATLLGDMRAVPQDQLQVAQEVGAVTRGARRRARTCMSAGHNVRNSIQVKARPTTARLSFRLASMAAGGMCGDAVTGRSA